MRNICLEGVAIFEELILYFRVFATLQIKTNQTKKETTMRSFWYI
jgi:hypothetical protein